MIRDIDPIEEIRKHPGITAGSLLAVALGAVAVVYLTQRSGPTRYQRIKSRIDPRGWVDKSELRDRFHDAVDAFRHRAEDVGERFDAIAPIVHADSIDFGIAWRQSRYDKEGPGGDAAAYVNCPMDKAQYEAFIDALLSGPKAEFKDWEHVPYFDGCLPIEVMAERGRETLRHGPMKPVGLTNPRYPLVKEIGRAHV